MYDNGISDEGWERIVELGQQASTEREWFELVLAEVVAEREEREAEIESLKFDLRLSQQRVEDFERHSLLLANEVAWGTNVY